jgi:hypothetical protein
MTEQTALRLSPELLARIDGFLSRMREQTPGVGFTRADAIRVLLTKALDAEEASTAKGSRRR